MTSPRSHSQEGSDAHTLSVHLQSQYPLTWPPSVFSPHSSSQLVAEPSPGGQGPGSSSLLAGLGPTGASARQVPAVSSAWLYSLPASPVRPASAGPGSPGELEEGRRAPAKCSADAASLRPPSYPGGGSTSTHFTGGRTKPEPGSHPSPADFKTFCPLRIVNPNGFQMRGAHQLGVPGTGSPWR